MKKKSRKPEHVNPRHVAYRLRDAIVVIDDFQFRHPSDCFFFFSKWKPEERAIKMYNNETSLSSQRTRSNDVRRAFYPHKFRTDDYTETAGIIIHVRLLPDWCFNRAESRTVLMNLGGVNKSGRAVSFITRPILRPSLHSPGRGRSPKNRRGRGVGTRGVFYPYGVVLRPRTNDKSQSFRERERERPADNNIINNCNRSRALVTVL